MVVFIVLSACDWGRGGHGCDRARGGLRNICGNTRGLQELSRATRFDTDGFKRARVQDVGNFYLLLFLYTYMYAIL